MMKFIKKSAVLFGIFVIGFLLWVTYGVLSNDYVAPIMMYHHVAETDQNGVNWVTPKLFDKHLAYLKKYRFNVMTLDELYQAITLNKEFRGNNTVITFDDGYDNNYTKALPILKKYMFPAAVFIHTDYVGQSGYLTWDQIKEMQETGITIGSHVRSAVYLPDLSKEEQEKQLRTSKAILEERLGTTVDYLAYPIGGFNEEIKDLARKAGYKAAFATNRGYDKSNRDVFELNRIRFGNTDDLAFELWAKLSGFITIWKKPKNPD